MCLVVQGFFADNISVIRIGNVWLSDLAPRGPNIADSDNKIVNGKNIELRSGLILTLDKFLPI